MKASKEVRRCAKFYNKSVKTHALQKKINLINMKTDDITYSFLRKKLFELFASLDNDTLFGEEQHCYAEQAKQPDSLAIIALTISIATGLHNLTKEWSGANDILAFCVLFALIAGTFVLYRWSPYLERFSNKKEFHSFKLRCLLDYKKQKSRESGEETSDSSKG